MAKETSASLLRLGTRGSALALAQADWLADQMQAAHRDLVVETIVVKTTADRSPHLPLAAIGDKGLWVTDLEEQLLSGAIDLAVHSLKDVPADLAPGLTLSVTPQRECPLDALALPAGGETNPHLSAPGYVEAPENIPEVVAALSELLPRGARVGTASDRRKGQLLKWRPDLHVSAVRGNVDTRLGKLDEGEWDALILAAAGLRRLGRRSRISAYFPPKLLLPAAGQGALGVEVREEDDRTMRLLAPLNHGPSAAAVAAERAFVKTVSGGCSVPLGVAAACGNGGLELVVRALDPTNPEGAVPLEDHERTAVPAADPYQDLSWAEALGVTLAERFLARGGDEFIERMRGLATRTP